MCCEQCNSVFVGLFRAKDFFAEDETYDFSVGIPPALRNRKLTEFRSESSAEHKKAELVTNHSKAEVFCRNFALLIKLALVSLRFYLLMNFF